MPLLVMIPVLSLASCGDKSGLSSDGNAAFLNLLSVTTENMQSKAVVPGTSFPDRSEIGLFVTGEDRVSVYDADQKCGNIRYSYSETSNEWTPSSKIILSAADGLVSAYYPYKEGNEDLAAIPVESSLNGSDYMYAGYDGEVNSSNSSISLTMRHALARISISFIVRKNYTGEGVLTNLSLHSAGIALSADMNAADGSFSNITASSRAKPLEFSGINHSLGNLTEECLIVPAVESELLQTLNISCTIDGETYDLVMEGDNGVRVQSGVNSAIILSLNGSGLYVDGYSDDYSTVQDGQW